MKRATSIISVKQVILKTGNGTTNILTNLSLMKPMIMNGKLRMEEVHLKLAEKLKTKKLNSMVLVPVKIIGVVAEGDTQKGSRFIECLIIVGHLYAL